MSRRLARETALQVLFQLDMTNETLNARETVQRWAEEFGVPSTSVKFAEELVEGTLSHKTEIDQKIASFAEDWALERMANVDRNLLRMATYEMIYRPDIPGRVSLNEAIELAKVYGGDESAKFVNGILDRLMASEGKNAPKDLHPEEAKNENELLGN